MPEELMKVLHWDCYNYLGCYKDEEDWQQSFFYANELETLINDINEWFFPWGYGLTFCYKSKTDPGQFTCNDGSVWLDHFIKNMACEFKIRFYNDLKARIDIFNPGSNEQETIWITVK